VKPRSIFYTSVLSVTVAIGCSDPTPTGKPDRGETVTAPAVPLEGTDHVGAAIALGATPQSIDENGTPQLLLGGSVANLRAASVTATARAYVSQLAPAWGVKATAVPVLDAVGEIPVRGGTIARIRPLLDGLPIEGGELRVLVKTDGSLGALGGKLHGTEYPRSPALFADDDAGAIAHAMTHAYKAPFAKAGLATKRQRPDGTRLLRGSSGPLLVELAQARKVWYPHGGALIAAWVVDTYASNGPTTNSDAWRTVVAGDDGRVLAHRSTISDANFTYRLFVNAATKQPLDGPQVDFSPHPTGTPNGSYPAYTTSSLVTVDGLNNSGGTPDPWLVAGKTETSGNNTDAYADLSAPDGFSAGDFRASTTAAATFDRTYNTAQAAGANQTQRMASITSAFYGINWLHDFWYDAGFTEVAGNAQLSNYGRGGVEGDPLLAEAQDYSGRNNANMSTPSDGMPPRMQIYVWDGPPDLDGGLDATLLAHEFGHYLHHRTTLCGTQLCGGMSEGFGDFLALMMLAKQGDNFATGAYPFGVYVTMAFDPDPAYYGIRRAPYSKSTSINNLSFRHITNGVALPTNHPILTFGTNAQVHNAGEIWAATLWEAYVSLQQSGGTFAENHQKMADYLVGGLLLMPPDQTPTEGRDAILAVAGAASSADAIVLAQAFARRGMGSCAVSPPRTSTTNAGLVESIVVAGNAIVGAATVSDNLTSCDSDGILDAGETVRVVVPVANNGPGTLTNVTVTLTSTTPGVTIVGGPVTFTNIPAYTTRNAQIAVSLASTAATPLNGAFSVSVTSTGGCTGNLTQAFALRLNVDDVPASSKTDSFDAGTSVWTSTAPHWKHVRGTTTPLDGNWHGDDIGALADYSLVSPQLSVGAGAFSVSYTQSYNFEWSGNVAWDGGVVELSTNNGATWADVTTFGANPMYTHTITDQAGNPLANRQAYSRTATNVTRTLSFGTQFSGQNVRLRFRIGTDEAVSAPGWDLDDVVFTGINGNPFPTQVLDRTACGGTIDAAVPDAAIDAPPPMIDAAIDAPPPVIDAAIDAPPPVIDAAIDAPPPVIDAAIDAPPPVIDAAVDAPPVDAPAPGPDAPGNPGGGDGGGCCDSRPVGAGNLSLAFGVFALITWRRRRKAA
jgi:hypothetical protein